MNIVNRGLVAAVLVSGGAAQATPGRTHEQQECVNSLPGNSDERMQIVITDGNYHNVVHDLLACGLLSSVECRSMLLHSANAIRINGRVELNDPIVSACDIARRIADNSVMLPVVRGYYVTVRAAIDILIERINDQLARREEREANRSAWSKFAEEHPVLIDLGLVSVLLVFLCTAICCCAALKVAFEPGRPNHHGPQRRVALEPASEPASGADVVGMPVGSLSESPELVVMGVPMESLSASSAPQQTPALPAPQEVVIGTSVELSMV